VKKSIEMDFIGMHDFLEASWAFIGKKTHYTHYIRTHYLTYPHNGLIIEPLKADNGKNRLC
jgi:hypothetical protein